MRFPNLSVPSIHCRTILLVLSFSSLLAAPQARAQSGWGMEAGLSNGLFVTTRNSDFYGARDSHLSFTPAVTVRREWNPAGHLLLTASASWIAHKFSSMFYQHTSEVSVDHRSSYLNLAPAIGLGFGRNHYVQFHLAPETGIRLSGRQQMREYLSTPGAGPGGVIEHYYAEYPGKIRSVIVQLGFELREQIPVDDTWRITLGQSLHAPLSEISPLATRLSVSDHVDQIRFPYWMLSIGLMRRD